MRDAIGDYLESPMENDSGYIEAIVDRAPSLGVDSFPLVWYTDRPVPACGKQVALPSNVPHKKAGASRLGAFEVYLVIHQPGAPDRCLGYTSDSSKHAPHPLSIRWPSSLRRHLF